MKKLFIVFVAFGILVSLLHLVGCAGAVTASQSIQFYFLGQALKNIKFSVQNISMVPVDKNASQARCTFNAEKVEAVCEGLSANTEYSVKVQRSTGEEVKFTVNVGSTKAISQVNLYVEDGVAETINGGQASVFPQKVVYKARIISNNGKGSARSINATGAIAFGDFDPTLFAIDNPDGSLTIPPPIVDGSSLYIKALSDEGIAVGSLTANYDPVIKNLALSLLANYSSGIWIGSGTPQWISVGELGYATCVSGQWAGGTVFSKYVEDGVIKTREKTAYRVRIGSPIELLNGLEDSQVYGIRPDGLAVGRAITTLPDPKDKYKGVIWPAGSTSYTILPSPDPDAFYYAPLAIAKDADVIPGYVNLNREKEQSGVSTSHAVVWLGQNRIVERLDEENYTYSQAMCVSHDGNYIGGFVAENTTVNSQSGCIWIKQPNNKYKLYVVDNFNQNVNTSGFIYEVTGINNAGEMSANSIKNKNLEGSGTYPVRLSLVI
jgi:hypothetical protein